MLSAHCSIRLYLRCTLTKYFIRFKWIFPFIFGFFFFVFPSVAFRFMFPFFAFIERLKRIQNRVFFFVFFYSLCFLADPNNNIYWDNGQQIVVVLFSYLFSDYTFELAAFFLLIFFIFRGVLLLLFGHVFSFATFLRFLWAYFNSKNQKIIIIIKYVVMYLFDLFARVLLFFDVSHESKNNIIFFFDFCIGSMLYVFVVFFTFVIMKERKKVL